MRRRNVLSDGFIQGWGVARNERVATHCVQRWKATCTLYLVCQDEDVFNQGKRKLRGGEVRAIELYCKHRAL